MKLIEIVETGGLPAEVALNDFLREVVNEVVAHYGRIAFVPPWLCFVGLEDGDPVAVGGFKSQPVEGRVEIAYGTVPGSEGKGFATTLATELLRIARQQDEGLTVVAQTLPEENASGSVLKKLGFKMLRTVNHPEDGLVWEWELSADQPLPGTGSRGDAP